MAAPTERGPTLKLFVAIAGHATLLPHFLHHYQAAGVTRFFVSVEPSLEAEVTRIASGFPLELVRGLDATESIDLKIGNTKVVSMQINGRQAHFPEDTGVVLRKLTITPETAQSLVN